MKSLIFAFVLTLFPLSAWSTTSSDCRDFSSGAGKYCIFRPAKNTNPDVIFYFHGSHSDENTWSESYYYTAQLRDYWRDNHLQPPTVVAISYGPLWLFAEANSSPRSGLFEQFVQRDFPEVEAALKGINGKRIVMGESMGGFNAAQLALKTKIFSKAAILCAPMADGVTPFSDKKIVDEYILKSSAWQYYKSSDPDIVYQNVSEMTALAKNFFPTKSDWASADPLQIARTANMRADLAVYLASGFYDRYVAYEGNKKFSEILRVRKALIDWRPQWGGHCSIDIPSLARFLVR